MDYKMIIAFQTMLVACSAQLIIPKRPLGYVYANGSNNALVHLDIHMGPLCPDSRDALPVAQQVADHYGATTLKLTLHMFPLPYHQQAFLTAKSAEIVRKLGGSDARAFSWFQHIYSNLDMFSNAATANMTTNDVISMLSSTANTLLGINTSKFLEQMKSNDIERSTRAAWKYSCTRAIASTPTFLLNDIIVEGGPTWTVDHWKQVIDGLLQQNVRDANKDPSLVGK